ncbi:MAG: hypothetical protein J6125_01850, partial [Clostridia bacterium]|nr:hypothetical protein [Clostridia bacterium]
MKKLSDFWYHYKWFVIALSVLAVVGLVLAAQTCRRREAFDCALLYAGPSAVSAPVKEELKQTASSASGAAVDLYHYAVSFASGSSGTTYEALTNFDAEIQSGEALILLLSPDLYARVAEQSAVVPLDGYLPERTGVEFADETHRAVRLSSLPL